MISVSIFEAKTNLSKYVATLINKEEQSIIIVRNGKPVAKLIPYESDEICRIGMGKEKISKMPDLEEFNSVDVEEDFLGKGGLL